MKDPVHTRTSKQTVSEHTSRYEALRNHALERNVPVTRYGLAVLLRQGVAAWLGSWSKMPAPPPQSTQADSRQQCLLPGGSSADVVHVLAAMTLGHLPEVQV